MPEIMVFTDNALIQLKSVSTANGKEPDSGGVEEETEKEKEAKEENETTDDWSLESGPKLKEHAINNRSQRQIVLRNTSDSLNENKLNTLLHKVMDSTKT